MIVDTSALVAIIQGEPEAEEFRSALKRARRVLISAVSYVETGVVLDRRRDPVLSRQLDELLTGLGMTITDVTAEQARVARAAYRDFGKGTGHPARLNLGDCFSYALAISEDDVLLFTGDDFTHTDVRRAI